MLLDLQEQKTISYTSVNNFDNYLSFYSNNTKNNEDKANLKINYSISKSFNNKTTNNIAVEGDFEIEEEIDCDDHNEIYHQDNNNSKLNKFNFSKTKKLDNYKYSFGFKSLIVLIISFVSIYEISNLLQTKQSERNLIVNDCLKEYFNNKCDFQLNVDISNLHYNNIKENNEYRKEVTEYLNEVSNEVEDKYINDKYKNNPSKSKYLVEFCKEKLKCISINFVYFSNDYV